MDVNFSAAAGCVFAGRAHVIFHVAGAEDAARINVFEAGENFLGWTFGYVGHHVEATTMAHAHD
jgi:hypothetical protein